MSVDYETQSATFYPDMNLDTVYDAEIVNEQDDNSHESAFDLSMVKVSEYLPKNTFSFSELEDDQTGGYMVGVAFIGKNQKHNELYLENLKKNVTLSGNNDPESLALGLDSQAYLPTLQASYEDDATYFDHPTSYMIDTKGNLMWNVGNERDESIALVLVRGNGEIEQLGQGDHSTSSGVVTDLAADDELYMLSNTLLASMRDTDTFNKATFEGIMDDTQFSVPADMVRVAFNEAVTGKAAESIEENDSDNDTDAVSRTVSARSQRARALRESLGLPPTATAAEVNHAKYMQRKERREQASSSSSIGVDELFSADEPEVSSTSSHASASSFQENRRVIIPALPDHQPTNHLSYSVETEQFVDKLTWKDNLRHPLAFLASRLDAARVIHQNKLEQKYSGEQLAERNRKQEKGIKVALGAVGVALVAVAAYKLGTYETHGLIDPSTVPVDNGRLSTDPIPLVDAAAEKARQIAAQHTEILNSPVQIIPEGGGGDAYALANGAEPSVWRNNQDEFMRLFPGEGYRMDDGNVGFSHPGELSDAAKEYWAKKFGKWL
ncbi:MAG TPA: hypothetical protein VF281_04400 [Candidatus Saccharimonadales bacterium]